jgi:hypothetical protein
MAQAAAPVALSELQEETRMERESRASAVDSAGARGGFGWRLAAERGNTSQSGGDQPVVTKSGEEERGGSSCKWVEEEEREKTRG